MPSDVHKEALLVALKEFMEVEVSALCKAEYGEGTTERENQRNSFRPREVETHLGTLHLSVPKLRRGSYFPSFLEPRRRWEQAFVQVVSEAHLRARGVDAESGGTDGGDGSEGGEQKRGLADGGDAGRAGGSLSEPTVGEAVSLPTCDWMRCT